MAVVKVVNEKTADRPKAVEAPRFAWPAGVDRKKEIQKAIDSILKSANSPLPDGPRRATRRQRGLTRLLG